MANSVQFGVCFPISASDGIQFTTQGAYPPPPPPPLTLSPRRQADIPIGICERYSHRLYMKLDLQSLFGLLFTAVLIIWDPATPPPAFGLICEGSIGQIGQPRQTTSLCNTLDIAKPYQIHVKQRSCADVKFLYQRKSWTNSVGPEIPLAKF